MKQLHRSDLYGWSEFNPERNLDFHSVFWVREGGNVMIDPLPLSTHDEAHVASLGGTAYIVITNSDHCRDARSIGDKLGAQILGPTGESDRFPITCDRWLAQGDEVVPGLRVFELQGSKTPGELALWLTPETLITGDLIRAHRAGTLCLLPDAKLSDKPAAVQAVQRLASLPGVTSVLPGDGWPVFGNAPTVLQALVASLKAETPGSSAGKPR